MTIAIAIFVSGLCACAGAAIQPDTANIAANKSNPRYILPLIWFLRLGFFAPAPLLRSLKA